MSCTIDSKVLRTALQQALRTNPEKYRNLENSVRDIVKLTNLTDEAKSNIIIAYSELYKQLSKKSTVFELNKLDSFIDATVYPLVNDTSLDANRFTQALNLLQEHLGITSSEETTQNKRTKELAAQLSEALESPVIKRHSAVKNAIDTIVRERAVLDAGLNETNELNSEKILRNALDKVNNSIEDKRVRRDFVRKLEDAIALVRNSNNMASYVDLRTLPGFGTNHYEVYLSDGTVVDLIREGEEYFYADENLQSTGELYVLDNNPKPKKLNVPNTRFIANDGATVLVDAGELRTGLVMIGEDVDAFTEELSGANVSPSNLVTIIADSTGAQRNASRMQMIQNATDQYPSLANRTIETRETPAQIMALQSGKVILTRGRMTDGFAIRMVSPTGKTVTLMDFNNYVVVYPDNTTRLLDLENEEDLSLFATLTQVRGGVGTTETTIRPTSLEDLQMLRDGARRFKEFKAEVQVLLDKGETQIPAELFNKYYELTNTVYAVDFSDKVNFEDRLKDKRLDQFLAAHESGITVSVINENDPGNVMERRLPLLFQAVSSTKGAPYMPVELLGPGEFILVEGVKYKWKEYVEKFELPKAGKVIANLSKLTGYKHAMIVPSRTGSYAVVPLMRDKTPSNATTKAKALLSLFGFYSRFDKTTATTPYYRNFNNNILGFDVIRKIQPDFFVNMTKDGKTFLGVQFTALDSHPDAEFFNEHASKLSFLVGDSVLKDITSAVEEFFKKEGLPADTSTPEGMEKMFDQLDGLLKYGSDKESVQMLEQQIEKAYSSLEKKLLKNFEKKIDALLNNEDATVREMAERMMGDKKEFMQQLFVSKQGLQPSVALNDRTTKSSNLDTYYTVKAHYKTRLNLHYNFPHALEDAATMPKNEVLPSFGEENVSFEDKKKPSVAPNNTPAAGSTPLDDIDEFDGTFSLGTALERSAFEQDEFQRQVDYIRDRLPAGIAIDDLEKIVRHLDAEGNVLGYIKDKVIYLSKNLSNPGTAYHEAFHAVFRYLLSPQERADLLRREYEKMGIISESQIAEFRKQRRGLAHMSNTEVIELMAEERMADKFQKYATKKTKAETWYQKLFNLIQSLLDFFTKHKDELEKTFDRIHNGYYKNATVKEYTGVEGAYALIKTVPTMGLLNDKIVRFPNSMNADEMMELRNMMVYEMLRSKSAGITTSDLYDQIAKTMVSYYNIENFISQNPSAERVIRETYENKLRDFRYVLGSMKLGEKFPVANLTGDPNYDNKYIGNETGETYTKSAEESYRQMKALVLEVYNNLNVIDTIEQAAASDQVTGENTAEAFAKANNDVEESGAKDPDLGLLETGTSEGDREFRKIFQFLVYEQEDMFGVTMRRPVDADRLFDTVKKITVNVGKKDLLPQIRQVIKTLEEDLSNMSRLSSRMNYRYPVEYESVYQLAESLKAMMKMLDTTCGIVDGKPTRSEAMFNQFHSVFYVASGEITRVDVKTSRSFEISGITIKSELNTVDMVQSQDNFQALNRIIDGYNNNYTALSAEDKQKIQNDLTLLSRELSDDGKNISEFYLENGEFSDAKVNKFADDLYVITAEAGLGIPRHFFHFSLAALITESGYRLPDGSNARAVLLANSDIFKEKGYMTTSMLKAMWYMFSYTGSVPLFENKDNKTRKSVVASFLPSMTYLTRYDSTIGQPVVMNTTGNKIYRFTLYSPNMQVVQDVQSKGLRQFVLEVYGPEFLSWFDNNPYLSEDGLGELFLDYLKVGYLGGLSQNIDDTGSINTDAADLDKIGIHLSNLALFTDRKSYKRGGKELKTFKRITSQNDATGTLFHTTGRYEQYTTNNAAVKTEVNSKKVSLISKRLSDLIKQEYSRIGNQWASRHENKLRYKDYNGILLSDNTVDTESAKLRAYQFHQLDSFFLNDIDPTDTSISDENVAARTQMRETLIAAAKEGKSFEEALALPAMSSLFEQLDMYAQDEFDFFMESMEKAKIVNKTKEGYSSEFFDTNYKENGVSKANSITTTDKFLKDYFFNDWVNRLLVNQLFDGDKALGLANAVDYYKRLKSQAAAGKNAEAASMLIQAGNITYRHAVITIAGAKDVEKEMPVFFDKNDITKAQSHNQSDVENAEKFSILDGHVYQRLNHRLNFLNAEGKKDARADSIIRSLRYKQVSWEDIEYLNGRGIQLNPQKTVTAHPIHYLKMSEHYINRFTVSYYKDSNTKAARLRVAELYKLADLYEGQLDMGKEVNENNESIEQLYRDTITKIHEEFVPINGREMLHSILNNMEFHRLGQVSDNSASKRGTVIPYVTSVEELENASGYWDLGNNVATIPMSYAYNQVATEAHHHDVTDSIQPKLLIDTDLDLKDPNVPQDLKDLVIKYRKLLSDMSFNARMKFERIVKQDGEIDVASFFKLIQESLQKQGAPQNMLKMWDVVDGQPVHSTNLNGITEALKYYVFSMANSTMFQPKAPGFKFYHGSSFGYKIIVDENDQPVPDYLIRKNPGKYKNYKTRYPSFRKTVDENGNEDYYVEVLIPRPTTTNPSKLRVIEKSMEEFFATRIPTEDKRSMVRVKVAGYIDATYINTIVVPEQVHYLSGSDKDIDALYARVMGTYENVLGELNIYGDYSEYENRYGLDTKTAKFVEYLHYMMDDPFFGPLVSKELRRMREDKEYQIENLKESSAMFGPKVQEFFNQSMADIEKSMENRYRDLLSDKKIAPLGRTFTSLEDLAQVMETQQDEQSVELQRQLRLLEKVAAVVNVLQNSGMPVTADDLASYEKVNGSPVIPNIQNEITKTMNQILGHKHVFDNLYSKESSNADIYKNAVETLGRDEKDTIGQSNFATITSVANVRDSNKSAKRGIEIFAAFNKALSVAVKHGLELTEPLWNINGKVYENFTPEKSDPSAERAHALIGNSLGMSADAAKKPYPAVLSLNQYNMGVTATMLSLGIDPYLSIYINLMPSVKSTIDKYMAETEGSVRRSRKHGMALGTYMNNALTKRLLEMKGKTEKATNFGLIEFAESFDLSDYTFEFDVNNVDANVANSDNPTVDSLGLKIVANDGSILTQEMKDVVILAAYIKQYEQAEAIRFELTPLTDAQKSLAPDFNAVDRLMETYSRDRNASSFKGFNNIFSESPVYNKLGASVELMDEVLGKMFLERSPIIKELSRQLNAAIFEATPDKIAGHIKNYLALNALKNTINKALADPSFKEKSPVVYARYKSFQQMLKADYWYNNDMFNIMNRLKSQFPENAFIKSIVPHKTDKGLKIMRSISKVKLSKDRQTMIMNGLDQLLTNADPTVREAAYQMFYYTIIKDGMGAAPYSLRPFLNPDNFREISGELKKIEKAFNELDEFGKTKAQNQAEYKSKFNSLFASILDEKGDVDTLIDDVVQKAVSIYNPVPDENAVKVLNYSNDRGKFTEYGEAAMHAAIKSIRPGMGEKIIAEAKNLNDPFTERKREYKTNQDRSVKEGKTNPSNNDLFLLDENNEVMISMKPADAKEQQVQDAIAMHYKIFPRKANKETGEKKYSFPLFVTNTYGDLLILSEVDDKGLGSKLLDQIYNKANPDQADIADVNTSNPFVGNKAVYKLVSRQGDSNINPLAFEVDEAIKLNEYARGTAKPEINSIDETGGTYKGITVIDSKSLEREGSNEPGGAKFRRGDNTIVLNRNLLREKYYDKAWTNPLKQRDNSYATAFPEDIFKSYEEWETFVMEHERQHAVLGPKQVGENYGQYEDRVNRAALGELYPGIDLSFLGKAVLNTQFNSSTTLKEYADKTSFTFISNSQVLRKSQIESFNDRVNDLIEGRLQYAVFVAEDLTNRQYLPFINKLKENGFQSVEGMKHILSRGGVNPKEEYAKIMDQLATQPQQSTPVILSTPATPLEIFVDGSDIKGTGKLGYGAAVEFNGQMYKMSGTEESKAMKSFQALFPGTKFSNPTMEMLGLVMTLDSFKNSSEHIVIRQDYKGAVNYGALWERSEGSLQREPKPWKAKEPYIQYLVQKAIERIEMIEANGGSVKLEWVKGHSGHKMNDAADEAAKNRGIFNEFSQLFKTDSVDKVLQSKTDESTKCN
jgi:ribonuclease HI